MTGRGILSAMPLSPETVAPTAGWRGWLAGHAAGVVAAGLGLVALLAAALLAFGGAEVDRIPDPRVTGPLLGLTLAAAAVALGRREGTYVLPLGGAGCALCAMVLGWAVVVAVIAAATAVIIVILSELL